MKVLITGAAGYLGTAVCNAIAGAGIEIVPTDRRRIKDHPHRIEVCNLLDREGVYKLFDNGVTALVHLGNYPNASLADAQRMFQENVSMNMNIMQAAAECGVKKVIFSSSVQVTRGGREIEDSKIPYLPLDGDAPPNPANAYALSKVTGELQLQYFVRTGEFEEAVAIRLPFLPHKRSKYVPPVPSKNHGNKLEAYAFLRVEDAGRLVLKCLQTTLPGYRCYFPAAAIPSNAETVQDLLATEYADVPLKKPAAEITALVDCSRITRETGWEPPRE